MERFKPATTGGIPSRFEAKVMEPPVKSGSGRGSDTIIPGTGTSYNPDGQPKRPRKSHKVRNLMVAGTVALGGVGGCVAVDRFGNQPSQGETPSATTIVVQTTDLGAPVTTGVEPQTTLSPSTTLEPTTTLEPQPTDVVEHRDGYDVLRNGGLLYEVESTPEFGGFELHMRDGQDKYGFKDVAAGAEKPQEVLFRDLLWTFGAQHPEFIKPEGGVDVKAYAEYLSQNNWIDTVYLPDNISEPAEHVKYPPVVQSTPLTLDFTKPVVLSSGDLGQIDGLEPFGGFYEYYYPTPADDARSLMGITSDGQFFLSYHTLNLSTGSVTNMPLDESLKPYSYTIGNILSITANITNQTDPQLQWLAPYMAYFVPGGRVDTNNIPDYERLKTVVLNFFDFVTPDIKDSALFTPVK